MIALRLALALLALFVVAPHPGRGGTASAATGCDSGWVPVSTPEFRGSDSALAALDRSGRDTWAAVNLARPGTANTPRSALLATKDGRLVTVATIPGTIEDVDVEGVSGWAVGSRRTSTGYSTTVFRLADGGWTPVLSANPGEWENDLRAVATDQAGNAWAVGTSADLGKSRRPLLVRLDGRGGQVLPVGIVRGELNDVAIHRSEGWAVGTRRVGSRDQGLVLKWDGDAWTPVPFPRSIAGTILTSVTFGPDGTAWAAGYQPSNVDIFGDALASSGALAYRWDGKVWTRVRVRGLPSGAALTSIASDGRAVVAVGQVSSGDITTSLSVVLSDPEGEAASFGGPLPTSLASVASTADGGFVGGGRVDNAPKLPFSGSSRAFAARLCLHAGN